jgi:hypothetical protein
MFGRLRGKHALRANRVVAPHPLLTHWPLNFLKFGKCFLKFTFLLPALFVWDGLAKGVVDDAGAGSLGYLRCRSLLANAFGLTIQLGVFFLQVFVIVLLLRGNGGGWLSLLRSLSFLGELARLN